VTFIAKHTEFSLKMYIQEMFLQNINSHLLDFIVSYKLGINMNFNCCETLYLGEAGSHPLLLAA
jgi:hypothetical protein